MLQPFPASQPDVAAAVSTRVAALVGQHRAIRLSTKVNLQGQEDSSTTSTAAQRQRRDGCVRSACQGTHSQLGMPCATHQQSAATLRCMQAWMHQCKYARHTDQDAKAISLCVCLTAVQATCMGLTTKSVLSVSFPASRSTSAIISWPPCSAAHAGQQPHSSQHGRPVSCQHSRCVLACKTLLPKSRTDTLLGTACTRCVITP